MYDYNPDDYEVAQGYGRRESEADRPADVHYSESAMRRSLREGGRVFTSDELW